VVSVGRTAYETVREKVVVREDREARIRVVPRPIAE